MAAAQNNRASVEVPLVEVPVIHDNTFARGKAKSKETWSFLAPILLRTLGLTILISIFSGRKNASSGSLGVSHKSRRIALIRGLVHLLPLSGAIALLGLNTYGLYIGAELAWLPTLQFVSKAHEMLMQTSIAVMVSTCVHDELLHRSLPFGAIVAGVQVTQLGYLWSPEIWGVLTSTSLSGQRKFVFWSLISLSVILAATVGPSSAIALIPRQTFFPAGFTYVWLNTTDEEIFPNTLNDTHIPKGCTSSPSYSVVGTQCPSSEWLAIATMLSNYPGYTGDRWNTLQSEDCTRQLYLDVTTNGNVKSVYLTTQQFAVTQAFQDVVDIWTDAISNYPGTGGNPRRFKLHYNYLHRLDTRQPYVVTRCLKNDIASGTDNVTFPAIRSSSTADMSDTIVWDTTDIQISNFTEVSQDDMYHITWLDLPEGEFPTASLGALITTPTDESSPTNLTYACTIFAGWGPANLNSTQNMPDMVLSANPPAPWKDLSSWIVEWVQINSSWAQYVTPPIEDQEISVDTAIYDQLSDMLTSETMDPLHPAYMHEAILSSLVVNGMARNAYNTIINTDDDPTNSSIVSWLLGKNKNLFSIPLTKQIGRRLEITSEVEGVAYSMNDTGVRIAFVALGLYCLSVLCHLGWTLWRGMSASVCESVAELLVLALGSRVDRGGGGDPSEEGVMLGIRGLPGKFFRREVSILELGEERLKLVIRNKEDGE